MRFRSCKFTPEMCECPLNEKASINAKMECACCKHSMNSGFWSRKFYCDDGNKCIMKLLPAHFYQQLGLFDRCLIFTGIGIPEISVERFRFLLSDILEIPKDYWLDVYDTLHTYLNLFWKYKDGKVEFSREDFEVIKSYAAEQRY